jgi:hypothetical protein
MQLDRAQQEAFTKQWQQMLARSLTDAAFKQRLLAEPSTVLAEQGIDLPSGIEVRVHEGPWETVNLTLPAGPDDELTDAELDFISGGAPITCSASCCTTYTQACACDTSRCIQ